MPQINFATFRYFWIVYSKSVIFFFKLLKKVTYFIDTICVEFLICIKITFLK